MSNQNEKKKHKKIKLFSDAFPKNINGNLQDKIIALSQIHEKIKYEGTEIKIDDIYFKTISRENLSEIIKLHKEWFPVEYSREFFEKIFYNKTNKINSNILAIGAFYSIEGKEYLIGTILCELKSEKNFRTSTNLEVNKKSFFEKIFKCYEYCYIMTIGVIDECRNLGLGSKLLKELILTLKTKRKNCIAVYLHVIDYNETAIKFYIKNEFMECNYIRNYYYLNKTFFHAKVLCRYMNESMFFERKSKDVQETISMLREPDFDEGIIWNFGNFFKNVFCKCKKAFR